MAQFLLCQWTFRILVIRELYNLVRNDVLLWALTPFDDLELGIVLQTTDKLVSSLVV